MKYLVLALVVVFAGCDDSTATTTEPTTTPPAEVTDDIKDPVTVVVAFHDDEPLNNSLDVQQRRGLICEPIQTLTQPEEGLVDEVKAFVCADPSLDIVGSILDGTQPSDCTQVAEMSVVVPFGDNAASVQPYGGFVC